MVESNICDKNYVIGNNTYKLIELLGKGIIGHIFKAINEETNEVVVIKIITLDVETEGIPAAVLREITILKNFKHNNVIRLYDFELSDAKILLCLEYLTYDLRKYWNVNYKTTYPCIEVVREIMREILKGVDNLHSKKVLHRNLKPQNILISEDRSLIKISDFWLGRTYSIPLKNYTKEVLTLWYRAPELILGTEIYSTGIDVWSIGCIFGELLLKKPLFLADSEINLLFKVFELLGSPNEETLPGYKTFPLYKLDFPNFEYGMGLESRLQNTCATKEAIDLLRKMLLFDTTKRISCKDALNHDFFTNK
jgi:cyclin-dependent kinase